tara:strand:- start:7414 stop:8727 length:1314 start_codon:yes stop_codon:yes gene_type:complete
LVPKKEYASIVIRLNRKVFEGKLEEYFRFEDVEFCAKEVESETSINVEIAVQYLLNFFLIEHPKKSNSYRLTQYAKNFIEVISDKISSPYSNLPLRQTFEEYFTLSQEALASAEQLNSWSKLSFSLVSKKVVSDHIESLYDDLKEATEQLNEVLLLKDLSALKLVEKFSEVFKKFVVRSREIREVINFKNKVLRQLNDFENDLYTKYDSYSAVQRTDKRHEFENSKKDWKNVKEIAQDVKGFFGQIDLRLDNIINQIHYASRKLNELGETFEKKALLKVNLKKMLRLALEDVKHSDGGVKFESFPLKAIPLQEVYFHGFKRYDFEVEQPNSIVPLEEDAEYFSSQENDFLKDVNVQERVSVWVDNLQQRLEAEKQINLSSEFQKIYAEEKSTLIPLRVNYNLIIQSLSKIGDEVIIKKDLALNEEDIQSWKILLKRK